MPSFLKRFSTVTGIRPSSSTSPSTRHDTQQQQKQSLKQRQPQKLLHLIRKPSLNNIGSGSSESSPSSSSRSSPSSSPTLSSLSSLDLPLSPPPSATPSPHLTQKDEEASRQSSSHNHLTQCPQESRSNSSSPASTSAAIQTMPPTNSKNRSSTGSLSSMFRHRSRSMPLLADSPQADASPVRNRASVDNLLSKRKKSNTLLPLPSPAISAASSSSRGKKARPTSLSGLLLQHEENLSGGRQPSPQLPKAARWASRGGIGNKNEMLIDLETSGVFVPTRANRLRPEFVYRTVIQCADEIRNRGLAHPNIFYNPSPKKTVSSMIALLTDQERAELYPIQCLRIDTVANLLLNLLSQMSNPVIPYSVMDYYFKQYGPTPSAPTNQPATPLDQRNADGSPLHFGLPPIPQLPSATNSTSSFAANATISWSRLYFDLPLFLDSLPALNRVILLEVLHLCAEILEHQAYNLLSLHRLVLQITPALFSTVFDQKMLEEVVGTRRCSIHGNAISAQDGSLAENHLFTVILVRFLYMTSVANDGPTLVSPTNVNTVPVGEQGCSPYDQPSQFRASQERIRMAQQEYYEKLEMTFEVMEAQGVRPQHFGQYTTPTAGPQPEQATEQPIMEQLNEIETENATVEGKGMQPLLVEEGHLEFTLPQPSLATRIHRDRSWHDPTHDIPQEIVV
ncbi:hypothetical protein BGZ94_000671 [Podila epigama]|nr:hypothetical protein BGZ94_000671 [Podila epigama]